MKIAMQTSRCNLRGRTDQRRKKLLHAKELDAVDAGNPDVDAWKLLSRSNYDKNQEHRHKGAQCALNPQFKCRS